MEKHGGAFDEHSVCCWAKEGTGGDILCRAHRMSILCFESYHLVAHSTSPPAPFEEHYLRLVEEEFADMVTDLDILLDGALRDEQEVDSWTGQIARLGGKGERERESEKETQRGEGRPMKRMSACACVPVCMCLFVCWSHSSVASSLSSLCLSLPSVSLLSLSLSR